jgi:hypothetical protein
LNLLHSTLPELKQTKMKTKTKTKQKKENKRTKTKTKQKKERAELIEAKTFGEQKKTI